MAEQEKDVKTAAEKPAGPKMHIGNGKTVYVCKTKCYHRDALYDVGHRVCPTLGGDLPAEYFEVE